MILQEPRGGVDLRIKRGGLLVLKGPHELIQVFALHIELALKALSLLGVAIVCAAICSLSCVFCTLKASYAMARAASVASEPNTVPHCA